MSVSSVATAGKAATVLDPGASAVNDDTAWSVVAPSPAESATPTSPAPATPTAAVCSSFPSPSVDTSWSDATRAPASPSVASSHTCDVSKFVEGDCELVTADGEVLTVPSYHLQSARWVLQRMRLVDKPLTSSPVFRKAIQADHGWAQARISVAATVDTFAAFFDIVTTGEVTLQWTSAGDAILSVARLSEFLGRYQCEAAANILVKHLKEQAGSVLPPITLMVAAKNLKRQELTRFMLMRHGVHEPQLWSLPNPAREGTMPFIPFEAYSLVPFEYQWAFRMAGVQGAENQMPQMSPYNRFCEYLAIAQKHKASSKSKTGQLGAGEESEWSECA